MFPSEMVNIWSRVLERLEPTISRPNFATWLKSTELLEDRGGIITIAVPNPYAKNWIERNAIKDIRKILEEYYDSIAEIRIVIQEKKSTKPLEELPLLHKSEEERLEIPIKRPSTFNSKYTFDTFIIGNNNRLAFAASQVVAEKPGEAYNPLFIYGGVGLGKTHLMQAIGNEILNRFPQKKIIYTSCEIFTSEFIQALQSKTINEFKQKYRTVDVLLVDDIQFLSNKEGTQEEFFHTFNMLHQSNRQIVVTSDRVPKEIPDLEERLSSRFGWGLIADIQIPNYETRVAILQAKAEEKNYQIASEVLEYIANTITSNVRELEGALIKLSTTAILENTPVTKDFAAKVLKDLLNPSTHGSVSSKKVIQVVAKHFDIESSDILGKKRIKELVYPRQIVMYLLREQLNQSYPQIGETLGGKDHTTVMHGVNKITAARKKDADIEQDIKEIQHELFGG